MPGPEEVVPRYNLVAQIFHWVIVALFCWLFYLAFVMTDLPLGPEKFKLYNLHKSLGITILLLTLLRLGWRRMSPPPPLPESMPDWQRRAASVSHFLIYFLVFVQVIAGIVHSWAADFPIVVFGLFRIPSPIAPSEALKVAMNWAHFIAGWSFFILLLTHILAALHHHFVVKDDILLRMIPGTEALQEKRRQG